jgi:hypothetical protein
MTAVLFVAAAFFVGLFGGALVAAARDYGIEQADSDAHRDELVRQWREGKSWGERKGYADGWTSGRLALVEEQQARRMHPTGSPESVLKALDAEADDRMRKLD